MSGHDARLRKALEAMELEKDDGYGGEWGQGKTAGVEACIDILRAALAAPTEPTLDVDTVVRVLHEEVCWSKFHAGPNDPCLGVNFGAAVAARFSGLDRG